MSILSKLIKLYDNLKLRKKLIVSLILISIIPVILVQIISYSVTTRTIKEQVNELVELNLEQSYNSLSSLLTLYGSIVFDIYNNDVIIKNVNFINDWGKQFQASKNIIRAECKKAIFSKDGILGIAVVCENGEISYYDSISQSNVDSFCLEINNLRKAPIYIEAVNHNTILYGETQTVRSEKYGSKNVFYIARQLVDFHNMKKRPIGVVILSIDEDYLAKAYAQEDQNDWSVTFVVNNEGSVISSPVKEHIGLNIYDFSPEKERGTFYKSIESFVRNTGLLKEKSLIVNSATRDDGDFIVVNVQAQQHTLGEVQRITRMVVFLSLLAISFATLIINYTSNKIDKSVKKIISAMDSVNKGNLDAQIDNQGKDEFAQISGDFNKMLVQMKSLIEKESRALNYKREAEIRALEAQINPHFLYNTLDSINWMAIAKEEYEISKMLKFLAIILRYSINKSNEIVYVSEELEYLKKYIYLQQNRYNYSFECIIRVDDNVKECKVHKLLIQPLIENALLHGFPGNTGRDRIEVEITARDEEHMLITVTNNGKGMSKELIDTFNNYDYQAQSIQSCIGIRNVISRIKMYYGEKGGFLIDDTVSEGTRIIIRIPYVR